MSLRTVRNITCVVFLATLLLQPIAQAAPIQYWFCDEPFKGAVTVVAHGTCAEAETDCATICEECYKITPKHVSVQRCDEGTFAYVAECLCSLKGS